MRPRALLAIACLPIAVVLAGCGGGDSSPTTSSLEMADFSFAPVTTTVKTGTTVDWKNGGDTEHTVKGPGFFSKAIEPGASYRHRFAAVGTFHYICTLHPDQMKATIVVEG